MALAQVGYTTFDTAKQIADAFDGASLHLDGQELFQSHANHFRALPLQTFCRAIQLPGQISRYAKSDLLFHFDMDLRIAL
jgi:hypothetical protein